MNLLKIHNKIYTLFLVQIFQVKLRKSDGAKQEGKFSKPGIQSSVSTENETSAVFKFQSLLKRIQGLITSKNYHARYSNS